MTSSRSDRAGAAGSRGRARGRGRRAGCARGTRRRSPARRASSAGSCCSIRVRMPSVTTSMRVRGPTRVSSRVRKPTVCPTSSPSSARHARCDRARRDAPRLEHQDAAVAAPGRVEQRERHDRALARARRAPRAPRMRCADRAARSSGSTSTIGSAGRFDHPAQCSAATVRDAGDRGHARCAGRALRRDRGRGCQDPWDSGCSRPSLVLVGAARLRAAGAARRAAGVRGPRRRRLGGRLPARRLDRAHAARPHDPDVVRHRLRSDLARCEARRRDAARSCRARCSARWSACSWDCRA